MGFSVFITRVFLNLCYWLFCRNSKNRWISFTPCWCAKSSFFWNERFRTTYSKGRKTVNTVTAIFTLTCMIIHTSKSVSFPWSLKWIINLPVSDLKHNVYKKLNSLGFTLTMTKLWFLLLTVTLSIVSAFFINQIWKWKN